MAAVLPVSYAEFYRVVTKDPHDGDPSAIFEGKTTVHVGGVQATPANIISAVDVRTLVHLPYRFVPLALDQHLTPRAAWTVLVGPISPEGGSIETQCAPLLAFLWAADVKGLVIPFDASDLEVVTPDKALEAQ